MRIRIAIATCAVIALALSGPALAENELTPGWVADVRSDGGPPAWLDDVKTEGGPPAWVDTHGSGAPDDGTSSDAPDEGSGSGDSDGQGGGSLPEQANVPAWVADVRANGGPPAWVADVKTNGGPPAFVSTQRSDKAKH